VILDTDVLILLDKNDPAARAWFASLSAPPCIAGFAAMELLAGCENSTDRRRIERTLQDFEVLWPDEATLQQAARDYGALRLSHGIGVLDMAIAVTAVRHNHELATFNARHFRGVPNLITLQPYQR
jgi:predicted nucleic acid-binding protein